MLLSWKWIPDVFCWFPVAMLVHQSSAPTWRLHTRLYKVAWNVSANNSETVCCTDLRLGEIIYVLVFYNISFSWLFSLNGLEFIFLWHDSENDVIYFKMKLSIYGDYLFMILLISEFARACMKKSHGSCWENPEKFYSEMMPVSLTEEHHYQ